MSELGRDERFSSSAFNVSKLADVLVKILHNSAFSSMSWRAV